MKRERKRKFEEKEKEKWKKLRPVSDHIMVNWISIHGDSIQRGTMLVSPRW